MHMTFDSIEATQEFAAKLGQLLHGRAVIELVGDVGAGKTTFTKGLARGLGVDEDVQSPSFTISRVYDGRDGLQLAHYDFYRLGDPGIMVDELADVLHDPKSVVVVEWADSVQSVLPDDRLRFHFTAPDETTRQLTWQISDTQLAAKLKALR